MYSVTEEYLAALNTTHTTSATAIATPVSGAAVTLQIVSGSVTATYQQGTRRTAALECYAVGSAGGKSIPPQQVITLLKNPGTRVTVQAGIGTSRMTEVLIPMCTGRPTDPQWIVGEGTLSLSVTDDWWRVSQGRFTTTWAPTKGMRRVDAVKQLMLQVAPKAKTSITATDTGTISVAGDWGENRDSAINTICTDGGFDAYFNRSGTIVIEDSKTTSDPVRWTMKAGDGGVLVDATTGVEESKLYNTVVVKPSGTDDKQKWTPQVAKLSSGPRAPATLGVTIPYFVASPTAKDSAAAMKIAKARLDFVTGTAETLDTTAIANPALDEGDVIQAIVPGDTYWQESATSWKYYVDSISWDLINGSMSLKARNEGAVSDDDAS
ncbi:MAG: hypothetical protein LKJ05_02835 [Bifidobacteriaceae bacterium]|jgi:hypothetical protein|nr:hypothetical protein [Bifidobacteriaceae bacterium]